MFSLPDDYQTAQLPPVSKKEREKKKKEKKKS